MQHFLFFENKGNNTFFKDHPEKLPPTRKYTNRYKIFNCEEGKIASDQDLSFADTNSPE